MLGSNTNKLVYVGVTLGVVGLLGVGATQLFPNVLDSTKTKMVSLTSDFGSSRSDVGSSASVLNRAEMTKPFSYRSWGTATIDYMKTTKKAGAPGAPGVTQSQESLDETLTHSIDDLSNTEGFAPVASVDLTSNTNLSGSDVYVLKSICYVIAGDKSVVNDISEVKSGTKYNVGLVFVQKTSLNGQPDITQSISNLWVDGSTIKQLVSDDGFSIVQHIEHTYHAEGDSHWDDLYAGVLNDQGPVSAGLMTTQEMTAYGNLPAMKAFLGYCTFQTMMSGSVNWNYATLSDYYSKN